MAERQKFLSKEDFACLFTFEQQASDHEANGYTVDKAMMRRLAELGAIQSHGFGRYSVTSFGSWLIETEFEQSPSLPLRTIEEWNRLAMSATPPAAESQD